MPIYEYQCQSCGHGLEKLQRMSDDPLKDCPDCGEAALKRLVSAAAFRLKGGGWYETDFKKDNKKNLHDTGSSNNVSSASNSSSTPASSGKSDAPAAKPVETKTKPAKPAGAQSS